MLVFCNSPCFWAGDINPETVDLGEKVRVLVRVFVVSVSKSTAPALDREELVGALVEVNLTEQQDARVEHYEADMAITLEDKGG